MMEMIGAYGGLFGGLLCGLMGIFLTQRKLRQNRGLDERYYEIERRAKNAGWWITAAGLVIMFALVIGKVVVRPIHVVAFLYILHAFGWCLSLIYYTRKL